MRLRKSKQFTESGVSGSRQRLFFPLDNHIKSQSRTRLLRSEKLLGLTIRMETVPLYKSSTRSPACAMFYQIDLKGRKTPKESNLK